MYHVLIVDDEAAVRSGLRNHFDWIAFNLQVDADFADGLSAYQYLKQHRVDLVVTDVRMPGMDGITLAHHIREEYPQTRILFVSGYDDTDYLKKAFKMDAVDYILKSIDLEEFGEAISRVTANMVKEDTRQQAMEEMEKKLKESIPLLQQRLLMLLVHETYDLEDATRERMRFLDIPLREDGVYCLLVLQIESAWKTLSVMRERERLLFTLDFVARAEEVLRQYGSEICFENHLGEYVMFVSVCGEEYEDTILMLSNQLRELADQVGQSSRIGVSKRFSGLCNIHPAYVSAVNAIHNRYYLNDEETLSVDKFEEAVTIRQLKERTERTLCDALSSGHMEQLTQAEAQIFSELAAMPLPDDRQNFLLYLLLLPNQVLANVHSGEKGPYDNQRRLMEQFLCCGDETEQQKMLLDLYAQVTRLLKERSEPHSNALITRIKNEINEKYMEQISISSLAENVHLTPTYLCVLFKESTGQTLNAFITSVRMDKAKDKLADAGIKLYDVCYQVGYLSPSYFSKLFKKYTRMTPSEYREQALHR